MTNKLNLSAKTATRSCHQCVHWCMNHCPGQEQPCELLETYDDWDRADEVVQAFGDFDIGDI